MRLLVAESDPALGTFLQRGFDAEHYAVDLTQDDEQARAMIQNRDYALAILDLQFSGDNGVELLRAVRAQRDSLLILNLGAFDCISKTFPTLPSISFRSRTNLSPRSKLQQPHNFRSIRAEVFQV